MEAKVDIAQVPTAAGTTEGTTPEPRPAAAEDAGKPCEVDEKNQSDLEESLQKMQKATMKRYQESSRAPSEATEADYEVADAEPGLFEDISTVVEAEVKAEKNQNKTEEALKDSTPVRPPRDPKGSKRNTPASSSSTSSSSEDTASERA